LQGASVHLRNRDARTPLFLAAKAGNIENVLLLRKSGAHLHAIELRIAGVLRRREEEETGQISEVWELTGAPVVESNGHTPSVQSDVELASKREEEGNGHISRAWELNGTPVLDSGQHSPMVHSDVEQVS
jgi:hypothetical protein